MQQIKFQYVPLTLSLAMALPFPFRFMFSIWFLVQFFLHDVIAGYLHAMGPWGRSAPYGRRAVVTVRWQAERCLEPRSMIQVHARHRHGRVSAASYASIPRMYLQKVLAKSLATMAIKRVASAWSASFRAGIESRWHIYIYIPLQCVFLLLSSLLGGPDSIPIFRISDRHSTITIVTLYFKCACLGSWVDKTTTH